MENQYAPDRFIAHQTVENLSGQERDMSNWRLLHSCMRQIKLVDCRFNYFRALDSQLKDLSFDQCLCKNGIYTHCLIESLKTVGSYFNDSHFVDCTFGDFQAELASFGMCVFDNCRLFGPRMSETAFIGSVWRDCVLDDCQFNFVRFPGSVFINTRFVNCTLRKAIFRAARFINCRFESCELPEAVFHNANFSETVFSQTDINQAGNLDGVVGLDAEGLEAEGLE